ncbi:MAG: acetylxylan esterase [Bacteroidota bacterium]
MKKILFFAFFLTCLAASSSGQFSQAARDSINRLSYQDHQQMMQMLGITELRPGPSGDPKSPNAANSDESKAGSYTLPDPLRFNNGKKVRSASAWEKRRAELFEDFDREIYGRTPENLPAVDWIVLNEKDTVEGPYPVKIRELSGRVDNSSFPGIDVSISMTLTLPAGAEKAVPVIVEFGWILPKGWKFPQPEGLPWQQQLLAKGWGYAILVPTSYQADNGAGLREGIIGLANKGEARKADDWGTLKAWAWGASRALDYFAACGEVDMNCVGIEGLSRYGKAALVAMACEPRFAIGFIGSSGAGGAKILRRTFGEQVENLASSAEYHWFAPNFIKYAGPLTPADLPVDAHELIALCAPRPVFISVGSPDVEGNWIDGRGMFIAAVHAGPVYTLLGKKDLGTSDFPPEETSLLNGDIAFRMHSGGHTVVPNWPYFIEFASRYFGK